MARSIRLDAVLIQAAIAGALSFAHLHDLAAAAGQSGWKAWAYPISVDLLLVAVWRRLRTDGPSRLAWSWFLVALVASLGANIATAGLLDLDHVPAWLRILVAGWPALAFLGGTLLAHTTTPPGHVADPAPVPPAPPAPVVEEDPEAAPALEAETVPELPAADPAPVPAPAPAAVPVPAALVDHARKVAADHQARTGARIDTDTLRARLGVPPHLADAIAAQLA
ncbi:DUF2637 domain-containing protein [Streptomyces gilvus]|uniref:DUF2637 domain-containing protein n=1 Tax=Streptomyces gilvus TaxID=2920937 RepID=UPI001F10BDB5|nr:DUF2637 domain-containing protein [Streptomyces sp. CME 23]MCH5675663.1 DUF2637 domain-containing protein [Streptomyces sp. CME 23]